MSSSHVVDINLSIPNSSNYSAGIQSTSFAASKNFWHFVPAILGTVVEYYDYALYGFFALSLSQHFFPSLNPTVSLIKTFGIFVAGSLSKPFGALLFGYLGDKHGRSAVLKITLIGIAIPTSIIGCLPGFNHIGYLAPILLLLCRIFQGVFVIGEYDGVRIFVYETLGNHRPNLATALINLSTMIGIYMASCAASIIALPNMPNWSWRIPFIFSGFLGLMVFFLRKHLKETPEFMSHKNENKLSTLDPSLRADDRVETEIKKNNISILLSPFIHNYKNILKTILRFGSNGGIYHFYFVFYGVYLSSITKILDKPTAILYCAHALFIYALSMPFAGWLTDKFGTQRILKYSMIFLIFNLAMNFYCIQIMRMPLWVLLATAINLAFFNTPGTIELLQDFPIHERYRCLSFSHALGSMIFSGTAPLVCLFLYHYLEWKTAPLLYCTFLVALGFISVVKYKKSSHLLVHFFKGIA